MSTHKSFLTFLLGASFLASSGAVAAQTSSAADRREVSITVYNGNFGLVREVRDVAVGTGRVPLEFRDVAATIQPETVHIRALGGAQSLGVLEQNYRYDLLTPQKLLEKHVGQEVRLHRYNERLGREDSFDARLLSVVNGQAVVEMNGEVTYGFPGRFSFPSVPENLMAKPTLVWLLDSKQARQQLEVTYLTRGMNWKADYVLVVNEAETGGALTGWVTLENRSGASYENARLKLVAGDVQRVSTPARVDVRYKAMGGPPAPAPAGFQEESFFEYHLYTLQQPTDVRDNEQKQVALLEAKSVRIQKKLIFFGQQYWYRGQYGQVQSNQKVGVYLDLKNSQENGLGMPLPKGTVRVYKADKSGSQQFIGEDAIDHTPRDEEVRIKMGEAFDVVGERKQTRWSSLGTCSGESAWEIELRNHKDQATQVEIFEPVGGDWTISESSHPYQRKDANTFTFDVKVPAKGKAKVTYRVRTRWC